MPNESKPSSFNPWPVAIIVFFALAICGAVAFVIFCTRQPVELVAADYYEQEIRFQDQLDRAHRASSLQAPATVAYDHAARRITVTLPPGHLNQPVKGWIQLYRPSAPGLDQKIDLHTDAAGAQIIPANSLTNGLWHVRLSWNLNGADYYFDQKVIVGKQ